MRGGAFAVVVGTALGVAAAVAVRQSPEPEPRTDGAESHASGPSLPASASPEVPVEASATPPPPMAPATASALPPTPVATAPAASSAPATGSAGPAAASGAPAANIPDVPLPPPVTTAKEVEQAEVRCYQQRPDECERAADAYDAGTLLPRDQERATRLRKVAFTYRVRACENRSPHACLVLAGRYQAGNGVERDSHKAKLLLEHARELCGRKPNSECAGGEPR